MLLFLASVLEQLDLASEHLAKKQIHDSRFALMLTDNAVELVLHQIAKDKADPLRMFRHLEDGYLHQAALTKALGRNFDAKVKFAKIEAGLSDEMAQTLTLLHTYRNELYHVGLAHEDILAALAAFHFDTACAFVSRFNPRFLSWGSALQIPPRAKRYFNNAPHFPGTQEDFSKACHTLRDACGFNAQALIAALADHLDALIAQQDTCIDIIADGVYQDQKTTRDKAVIETQVWQLAFSQQGRDFALSRGWNGNLLQMVEWLAANYPITFGSDPIPSWTMQAARLRSEKNPHKALSTYQSFLTSTEQLREAIEQAAAAAEAEIEAAIERMRGK